MAHASNADLHAIAAEHGTPFYLYDVDAITAHAARLRGALPAFVRLYYCLKANGNLALLKALRASFDGLDISSGGELELALASGYATRPMSFAGPGKTDDELRAAVEAGVGVISVESEHEASRLSALARSAGVVAKVTVRINPQTIAREFAMKMGGQASQFGVHEEDAAGAIASIVRMPNLDVCGIHVFSGTQCLDAGAIVANMEHTLALSERLASETKIALRVVNLGGGFGVPYFPGQEALGEDALYARVASTLTEAKKGKLAFANTEFILELGRYLVGPFGVYVARVLDIKENRGKRFVILDGGMNHCFPATGNFGQLVKKNYPVTNLTNPSAPMAVQELVGPLCTPIDSMARAIEMPQASIGDLVAFQQCGAYSFAASPLLFLSHPTPLELLVQGGTIHVARKRWSALAFQ